MSEHRIESLLKQLDDMRADRDAVLSALNAASGYMSNAAIDLETGAPKKTALGTIYGGLRLIRAAIAKAEGR